MTPKQKIYAQIIDVRNETDIINGLQPGLDKDRCLASNYTSTRTTAELERELEIAKSRLASARYKADVAAYYKTEPGIIYKQTREAMIADWREKRIELWDIAKAKTQEMIYQVLGKHWAITSFSDRQFCVCLMNEDGKLLTHHEMEIYFDDKRFEMNYGSFGAFDPTNSPYRTALLVGMATMAKPIFAECFKDALTGFHKISDDYGKEIYKLEHELENPPID